MRATSVPVWFRSAQSHYSRIRDDPRRGVYVYDFDEAQQASDDSPGRLCLRLEPRGRYTRVFDPDNRETGVISRLIPGFKYVMHRDGNPVWTLAVRSVVRKRHRLYPAVGERWTFETPFFWWQPLSGRVAGMPALFGDVGPDKRFWIFRTEPGRDTVDLLAAVAFMHWQWWHS